MTEFSFVRSGLPICAAIGLLSLASCSGGDSANTPADYQSPAATPSSGKIAASTASNVKPRAVSTTPSPKNPPESFLKRAEAPPPSYPGLTGTVTKAPEWAVKNAPFDVNAYFTAPAENAAPVYLDALFEFDPEAMKYCLAPEEVARRGPSATARAKRASELIEAFDKNPKAVAPATISALVAEYEHAFQLLAAAQERKVCVFESGTGHLMQIPHVNAARTAGRVLALQILSDLMRGDTDRAIGGVEIQLRFSRDIRSRSGAIGTLVSMSLDGRVCRDVIPQILAAPDLTRAQCDRLLADLRQHEAAPEMVVGILQGEYMLLRSLMRPEVREFLLELAVHPELDLFQGAVGARAYKVLADNAAQMTPADFDAQIEAINEWYRAMERLSQTPRQQRGDAVVQRIDEEAMRSRSPQLPGRNPILATFFPNDVAILDVVDRVRAFHRGALCLIALRRWQLEHDGQPGDLDSVVKAAGIPTVPIDPFSDGPLKMTVVNGETVIYSVGPDDQDDNALIEWDPEVQPPRGDIIFRLPPPSDRIRPVKPIARKWTDKSGRFSITAELIDVKDGAVQLKRQDGKVVKLPADKLSDADQTYVRERSHQDAGKP